MLEGHIAWHGISWFNNKILRSETKTDNVAIEYLAPDFISCRSVIVDFGKVCLLPAAFFYN